MEPQEKIKEITRLQSEIAAVQKHRELIEKLLPIFNGAPPVGIRSHATNTSWFLPLDERFLPMKPKEFGEAYLKSVIEHKIELENQLAKLFK